MAGNPYLWSTTSATNSSSDADINWAEGQLPSTLNDSARALMAGVAGWLKDTNSTLTTGGSGNAQTVTSNIAYPALATGIRLVLKAGFTNTGAATLNLTPAGGAAFGAKAIKIISVVGEVDPSNGNIQVGGHYHFEYDTAANAAAGAWILLNPSSGEFTTGDAKVTIKTVADAGWIMMDDGSIGNASSNATTRANADTSALFTLMWTNITRNLGQTCTISNASPAVITIAAHGLSINQKVVFTTSGGLPTGLVAGTTYFIIAAGFTAGAFEVSLTIGGAAINTSSAGSGVHTCTATFALTIQSSAGATVARGASAAADYAANNRIVIPKQLGRSLAVAGAGSGLTSRFLGETAGAETETPTVATMAAHTHNIAVVKNASPPNFSFTAGAGVDLQIDSVTQSTGGGVPFNILDPSAYWNVMMKL